MLTCSLCAGVSSMCAKMSCHQVLSVQCTESAKAPACCSVSMLHADAVSACCAPRLMMIGCHAEARLHCPAKAASCRCGMAAGVQVGSTVLLVHCHVRCTALHVLQRYCKCFCSHYQAILLHSLFVWERYVSAIQHAPVSSSRSLQGSRMVSGHPCSLRTTFRGHTSAKKQSNRTLEALEALEAIFLGCCCWHKPRGLIQQLTIVHRCWLREIQDPSAVRVRHLELLKLAYAGFLGPSSATSLIVGTRHSTASFCPLSV